MSAIFSTINPNTTSGTQLATILDDFKDCVVTGFATNGGSRPTNLQAGGYWVDMQNDPIWDFYVYDGTDDIQYMSINTSTNSVSFGSTADSLTIEKITDDSLGATIDLLKKRIAGSGQTQAGDTLGQVDFSGYSDTATNEVMARIQVVSNENVTTAAHGSYMRILTTQDGTSSLVERMRIFNDGKIGIGTQVADARVHVKGTSATGNIKNEVAEDSAVGPKTIKKKARLAGSGQVLNNDVIASDEYQSTDEGGSEVVVAETKVTATENSTSTQHGSKYSISIVRTGETSLTEEVTVDNGETTFNSTTTSTSPTTGSVKMAGGLGVAENLNVGGNIRALGNFIVEGDTITQNVSTWEVEDAQITLNLNGNEASADDTAGILIQMSDATDCVVMFDKDSPTKFKIGEVGAEANIVDESTAQDVSNKAIKTPSQLDAKADTFANLETYAATATNGQFCFATDQKVMYQIVDNALTPVGSGGGGLDIYFREDFSVNTVSNLTVGNSATFKGSDGSLGGDGTLADNTVTPQNGTRSILYTSDSTTPGNSLNDYWYSEVIDTALIQRDFDSGVTVFVRSQIDAEVVIWDVTNGAKLNSTLDTTGIVDGNEKRYSSSFFIPANCTQIQYGFHILTTPTGNSLELEFTNLELSTNPFVYSELVNLTAFTTPEALTVEATTTAPTKGTMDTDETSIRQVGSEGEISIDFYMSSAGTSGTGQYLFSLPNGESFDSSVSFYTGGASVSVASDVQGFTGLACIFNADGANLLVVPYDATRYRLSIMSAVDTGGTSGSATLNFIGDADFPFGSASTRFTIKGRFSCPIQGYKATSEHVITPAKSSMTDWISFTPTLDGGGTLTGTEAFYRRVGKDMEIKVSLTTGTPDGTNAALNIPGGFSLDTNIVASDGKMAVGNGYQIAGASSNLPTGGDYFEGFLKNSSPTKIFITPSSASGVFETRAGNGIFSSTTEFSFHFTGIPIDGWSSDASFLAAIPVHKVVMVQHDSATGRDQLASTTAYKTRDIDALVGDSFASIGANQISLPAGKYTWNIPVSIQGDGDSMSVGIYNTGTTNYLFDRVCAYGAGTGEESGNSTLALFTLTEPATLELRTKASNPGGTFEYVFDSTITKLR